VLRPAIDGIAAAFTTRLGGVSRAPYDELNVSYRVGDDDEDVRANRETAGATVGSGGTWSVVKQVHGGEVVPAADGPLAEADGVWTDDADRTLAVMAADCVPVLVAGARRVALAHAGWRGLVAGVVENAVASVGAAPTVFVGPAIGPCCYEVGGEVSDAFVERFGSHVMADARHLDLWRAAADAARAAGAGAVSVAGLCTSCHPDLFFSHRRDAGTTGRQAIIARLGNG
jgi:YfiH family protein